MLPDQDRIHAYFDVDMDRVWTTITDDLPFLESELIKALSLP